VGSNTTFPTILPVACMTVTSTINEIPLSIISPANHINAGVGCWCRHLSHKQGKRDSISPSASIWKIARKVRGRFAKAKPGKARTGSLPVSSSILERLTLACVAVLKTVEALSLSGFDSLLLPHCWDCALNTV
jgi:hypothetical protein